VSLTDYVARFVVETPADAIPSSVLALGKRSVLDGIGLALAGQAAESGQLVRQYLASLGCATGPSTIVGTDLRLAPRFAAFSNGVAIHADDYDDTQLATAADRVYGLLTHPTAPVLPAVLALAEREGRSGADTLAAYVIGVEVECKVCEAMAPRHYQNGFHSTGTVGTIGAAAGAARLLGYDRDRTRRSLGIAASQAAGLRENFGTMTKPFHAGRAAESGVMAAELAGLGWTAAPTILEAARGFYQAAAGGYDPHLIEGQLGAPWTFDSPGISIKPHPSGSLTHPGMGLVLDLIRQHDLRPEQVRRVKVGTNRHMPNALIHHRPRTELEAKFSMEFCLAILLLERRAGLAEFTDAVVNRPDVQAMIEKVEFGVHPEAEAAGYDRMTTIIDVELADGRTVSGRADFGKGSPTNPLSDAELEAKFRECVAWGGLSPAATDQVAELAWRLEEVADIRELTTLLRRRGS
jgi:2-methylcitrate dehydratase PrpD